MSTAPGFITAVTHGVQEPSGWYVGIACAAGILTANTPLAPFITGVLAIAVIYQTNAWLTGK